MEAASSSQSRPAGCKLAGLKAKASVIAALLAGLLLRIWMFRRFFATNGDTAVYGDIARNLLEHGRYALTVGSEQAFPTLIRLPGYPLLLAAIFKLFGVGNYGAVVCLQIALELAGCLLLADCARRIAPTRYALEAAQGALWLARSLPLHRRVCGKSADRRADALLPGAGDSLCCALSTRAPMDCCAALYARRRLCCFVAAGWRPGCHRLCARSASAHAQRRSNSRQAHRPYGNRLRLARSGPFRRVDRPQLECLSRLSAVGPTLGHRPRRSAHARLGCLGEDLVSRLHLNLSGCLERSRRRTRHRQTPQPRLRFAGAVRRRPQPSPSPTTATATT